jgi:hypothetical protein
MIAFPEEQIKCFHIGFCFKDSNKKLIAGL